MGSGVVLHGEAWAHASGVVCTNQHKPAVHFSRQSTPLQAALLVTGSSCPWNWAPCHPSSRGNYSVLCSQVRDPHSCCSSQSSSPGVTHTNSVPSSHFLQKDAPFPTAPQEEIVQQTPLGTKGHQQPQRTWEQLPTTGVPCTLHYVTEYCCIMNRFIDISQVLPNTLCYLSTIPVIKGTQVNVRTAQHLLQGFGQMTKAEMS